MLAYVLPGNGIFGGVKKGFHCAEMLSAAGHRCVAATPDGARPGWFETACEVITHAALARGCQCDDVILFSCPADAPFVDALRARRKIVHMQGANTTADHELFDPKRGDELISHGLHMSFELQRHGCVAPYVPSRIPDVFRWKGEPKMPLQVAVMPRKGGKLLPVTRAFLPARKRAHRPRRRLRAGGRGGLETGGRLPGHFRLRGVRSAGPGNEPDAVWSAFRASGDLNSCVTGRLRTWSRTARSGR